MPRILHKARKPNWPNEPFTEGGSGGTRYLGISWRECGQRCGALGHHSYSAAHATSIIKIAKAFVHFVLIFHQRLSEQCCLMVQIRAIWHDQEAACSLRNSRVETSFYPQNYPCVKEILELWGAFIARPWVLLFLVVAKLSSHL